jgi:transposase
LGGDLFLFAGKRRNGCKVLLWDGTGLCIFQKRLERGRFALLFRNDGKSVQLTASELAMFIEGCEIVGRRTLSPGIQIEHLLGVLRAKCEELEALKGDPAELQQTLALVETLTRQQQKAAAAVAPEALETEEKPRKRREEFGPTEQLELPVEERVFELDEPDRVCPSCGGALCTMEGHFEESEMIDLVDVDYRLVKVKQRKYTCRNLAMDWIGELYAIDERAGDDLEHRLELRRTESAAVLKKLKTWLWNQAVLKTLSIGRAAAYAIAKWDRLTVFVNNALVPLDNNGTERAIRG